MENNTNAVNEGTQAANVGQESVQGTTGNNDKRFTQEEVNSFIQSPVPVRQNERPGGERDQSRV